MFTFLHDLGLAIENEPSPTLLSRIIVDGIDKVVSARGGAIYFVSAESDFLNPSYLSDECPPLIGIPVEIRKKAERDPRALESHLRLSRVGCRRGNPRPLSERGRTDPREGREKPPIVQGCLLPLHGRRFRPALPAAPRQQGPRCPGGRPSSCRWKFHGQRLRRFPLGGGTILVRHRQRPDSSRGERKTRDRERIEKRSRSAAHPASPAGPVGSGLPDQRHQPSRQNDQRRLLRLHRPGRSENRHRDRRCLRQRSPRRPADGHVPQRPAFRRIRRNVPLRVMAAVNRQLFPDIREDMFISMAYSILDAATGKLTSPARVTNPRSFSSGTPARSNCCAHLASHWGSIAARSSNGSRRIRR